MPNTDPLRIPLAELAEGVTIVRHTHLGPDWREPKSKTRFEFRHIKRHRRYLEFAVRYGLATEDELGIRERTEKTRSNFRVHASGAGQIASIDELLLEWDGQNVLVYCNTNTGTRPVGMEKGAGNRLVDTPPLVTHQRRLVSLSPPTQQTPVPVPRWLDDY